MKDLLDRAGRRFARLATDAVVAKPWLWRLFRRPVRAQFDRIAPVWDDMRSTDTLTTLAVALDGLEQEPRRILDAGTGTGVGARALARRYPEAEVVAFDLSPAMIAEANRLLPEPIRARVRYEVADAAALPYGDGEFDLVLLLNMIPFFAELARVTHPEGTLAFVFSSGPQTPMYASAERLRRGLTPFGFDRLQELEAAGGTAVLARRSDPR